LCCPKLQRCLRVEAYALTTEIALNVGYFRDSVKRPGGIVHVQTLKGKLRVCLG